MTELPEHPDEVGHLIDQRPAALYYAVLELETVGPVATATEQPGGGWKIAVTDRGTPKLLLSFAEWEEFRTASAGHRLIDAGWMIRSCAHHVGTRIGGWSQIGTGPERWSAPVTPAGTAPVDTSRPTMTEEGVPQW